MTMPAPMPVPTVMRTTWSWPRAAPSFVSAHTAAFASFSTITGRPIRSSTRFLTGSSRQARFGANSTLDRISSTNPAAPMPTASTSCLLASSITTPEMTLIVSSGLAAGVYLLSFSMTFPWPSTTPPATFVPPTSTPIARPMVSPLWPVETRATRGPDLVRSPAVGWLARRRCRGPRVGDRARGGQPVAGLPADRTVLAGHRVRRPGRAGTGWVRVARRWTGLIGVWLEPAAVGILRQIRAAGPVASARCPAQETIECPDGVLHRGRHRVAGSRELAGQAWTGAAHPARGATNRTPLTLGRLARFGRDLGGGDVPYVALVWPVAAERTADLVLELAAHVPGTRPD